MFRPIVRASVREKIGQGTPRSAAFLVAGLGSRGSSRPEWPPRPERSSGGIGPTDGCTRVAEVTTRGMVTATVVAAWICMMMVGGCARGVDGGPVAIADPKPVGFIESVDAGFSVVAPPGWTVRDDSDELIYGDVALVKEGDDASMILIGELDGSLFASARADNRVAAKELGAGMGEFFFPDSGARVDREGGTLSGAQTTGAFEFYRVEFDDRSRSDAEVFSAVVEKAGERWWMTWLSNNSAVELDEACELAESITPM